MPCDPVKLPGGGTALVCSRARRPKPCAYCQSASGRLCDFPVLRNSRRTTCDEPLCPRCTTRIAGDGDLCRAHAAVWDFVLSKPKVGPGAEEPQR